MEIFKTNQAVETQKIAHNLASKIKPASLICLFGNLGSGKTTFVQGMAKYFKLKRIVSPTYNIIKQYPIKSQKGLIKTFYHIDLYRLKTIKDTLNLGLEEILADKQALKVIEWPEIIINKLPQKRTEVFLTITGKNQREIKINHLK